MKLTPRDGLRVLNNFERRARAEADSTFCRRYNGSLLKIHSDGTVTHYMWGKSSVGKHIALNVICSFEQAPRR